MPEFESLTECIEYNHSTLIIDLRNYISPCSQPEYMQLFKPVPKGIYLKGELSPVLDLTNPHYLRPRHHSTGSLEPLQLLTSLEQLKDQHASIVDEYGNVKLSRANLFAMKRSLVEDPGYGYQAVRAAAYFALTFLNNWCKHSRITPPYSFHDIFKEEALHMLADESLDVFKQLKFAISSFVGEDDLFLYYYKLKGTTLYIQKNVDFRVYDYYLRKFAHE